MLIPEVVGVGEVAVSDHRGSQQPLAALAGLASEVRVGGMLAGKAGLMYCHLGSHKTGLAPLRELTESTALPIANVLPTHMERTPELVAEGKAWLRSGGRVDFSGYPQLAVAAILEYQKEGLDLSKVTLSSDAYGSLPVFDTQGQLVSYSYGRPEVLWKQVKELVSKGMDVSTAVTLVTSNPADALGMRHKGRIAAGADADLLVVDAATLDIDYVIGRGRLLKTPSAIAAGMFEASGQPGSMTLVAGAPLRLVQLCC